MFDEPVNGLDPEGILWIRNLMKALAAEGRTVFVSSHLMSEMENTADHLLVIGRGRLIADCTVQEFIDQNSELAIRVRTPRPQRLAELLTAAGGRADPDGTDGAAASPAWPEPRSATSPSTTASGCTSSRPLQASLEEAFMELTRDSVEFHAAAAARSARPRVRADPGEGGMMTSLTLTSTLPPATGRAGLSGALRSEWTKIRSVRSTLWSIAAMAAIAIGLNALINYLGVVRRWDGMTRGEQARFMRRPAGQHPRRPDVDRPVRGRGASVSWRSRRSTPPG